MQEREKVLEIVQQLNIIDDTFFQKMTEDIGFCEEMISTILEQKVTVKSVVPQNSIKNLQGRSVVLDALCMMKYTYLNLICSSRERRFITLTA